MKPINLTHTHKPWWMLYIITSKQTLIKPLYIFPTQTLLKPVHLLHTDPTETSTPPTHRPCWNQYTSYTQTLLKPVHLLHTDPPETSTPPTCRLCWNQYTSYTQTLLKPVHLLHTDPAETRLLLHFSHTDPRWQTLVRPVQLPIHRPWWNQYTTAPYRSSMLVKSVHLPTNRTWWNMSTPPAQRPWWSQYTRYPNTDRVETGTHTFHTQSQVKALLTQKHWWTCTDEPWWDHAITTSHAHRLGWILGIHPTCVLHCSKTIDVYIDQLQIALVHTK